MFLVVVQYKQKAALLLRLFAVKAVYLYVAMQIPKRLYTLEELRLNNLRPEEFLSPEDSTLNTVRTILQVMCITIRCLASHSCKLCAMTAVVQQYSDHLFLKETKITVSNSAVQLTLDLQAGGLAGVTAIFFAFHLTVSQALGLVVAVMFVVVGDQVRS